MNTGFRLSWIKPTEHILDSEAVSPENVKTWRRRSDYEFT